MINVVFIDGIIYHDLLLLGAELPLVVESFGLLNDIFPFPSILDAGYPVFNLYLANILFDVNLPSVLWSSLIYHYRSGIKFVQSIIVGSTVK
jgi:hypothetical protein